MNTHMSTVDAKAPEFPQAPQAPQAPEARTVVIVDDNAEFRRSAQWWLSSAGYEVVDYGDPQGALDALGEHPPSGPACLLLDVRMPGMSGLDLHDRLLARGLHLPIVYMTGHGDVPLAVAAMQKGAISFLEKPFAEEALEEALQRAFSAPEPSLMPSADLAQDAARHSTPVPTGMAPRTASSIDIDPQAQAWQARLLRLTPRESELLRWVVEDKLNKTIADLMGISIKTVELHRKRVMSKLGATSATQLMRMWVSGRVA
jgi:two-component system, LuxR family, response regulator FixJ